MRVLCVVAVLLVGSNCAIAQGFGWQPSPRDPFTIPKRYMGVEVGSGYTIHGGSLDYIEAGLGITCCSHSAGSGIPWRIGVTADEWISPTIAVSLSAGVSMFGVAFVTPTTPVPLSDGVLLRTEYVLEGNLTYATFAGAVSTRLFESGLYAGGGLRLHVFLGGSLRQTERVVSPDSYYFTTNPRSKEVEVGTTFLDNATPVQVEPYITVGYNVPLAPGYYLSPAISAGIGLLSVTTTDPWRMIDLGVHLRFMKGL